jgi:hypothetical protein
VYFHKAPYNCAATFWIPGKNLDYNNMNTDIRQAIPGHGNKFRFMCDGKKKQSMLYMIFWKIEPYDE